MGGADFIPAASAALPCRQVYVHVTVRTEDGEEVLYSTRGQDGGNGQAMAFIVEAGKRAPRAWEIALKSRKSV